MWETEEIPRDWSRAVAVPIYKKLEEYFGKTKDWEPWLVVARSVSATLDTAAILNSVTYGLQFTGV